jgi:tripartite-type tricarboxylate transporter receptor subunit TctC
MRKLILTACLLLSFVIDAKAQADFYQGKTINIVVGFTPGGTYDQIARFYARQLPRFLPGKPNVIVQNMPGAGSMIAANHMFNVAPKDGTALGILGGGTVWEAVLGNPRAKYDARQFNWLVGKSRDNITCLVWHTSPIKTMEDVIGRETSVGATGTGSRTVTFPRALNDLVGTKFRVVAGYPGGNEITMALERGEVEGYCGWALGSLKQRAMNWYTEKKVRFLVQFAPQSDPELTDVPLAIDIAKTDESRRMMEFLTSEATLAWTTLTTPGVPSDRVELLRRALAQILVDKDALAEADREKLEIDPVAGEELQALVEKLYATPLATLDAIRRLNDGT